MVAYAAKGLIDLSAGSGEGCKAAMSLRKPCLAFCFNDEHVRQLFDHLVSWVLECMTDSKSVLYNQNYANFKKTSGAVVSQTESKKPKVTKDKTVTQPKRARSPDDASTQKDKAKKARSRKASSSSSSSEEDA